MGYKRYQQNILQSLNLERFCVPNFENKKVIDSQILKFQNSQQQNHHFCPPQWCLSNPCAVTSKKCTCPRLVPASNLRPGVKLGRSIWGDFHGTGIFTYSLAYIWSKCRYHIYLAGKSHLSHLVLNILYLYYLHLEHLQANIANVPEQFLHLRHFWGDSLTKLSSPSKIWPPFSNLKS